MQDLSKLLPASTGWMHSGIAVDEMGTIFCAHQEGNALVQIDRFGNKTVLPVPLAELHGICLTRDFNLIGVADPGWRMNQTNRQNYEPIWSSGRAVILNKFTGELVLELPQPELPIYKDKIWRPTSISIDLTPHSSGAIWVADGYGESLVHRFDWHGNHELTLDGSASGCKFDCPHAVAAFSYKGQEMVLVADRTHHRVVVFSSEGDLIRVFGSEKLDSPSDFAIIDDTVFITELFGGVKEFKLNGTFVRSLESKRIRNHNEPGWPNQPSPVIPELEAPKVPSGSFNSPHGICSHEGDLYLTEWMIGGRLVKIGSSELQNTISSVTLGNLP